MKFTVAKFFKTYELPTNNYTIVILFIFEGSILTVFFHITKRNYTVTLELSIKQLS